MKKTLKKFFSSKKTKKVSQRGGGPKPTVEKMSSNGLKTFKSWDSNYQKAEAKVDADIAAYEKLSNNEKKLYSTKKNESDPRVHIKKGMKHATSLLNKKIHIAESQNDADEKAKQHNISILRSKGIENPEDVYEKGIAFGRDSNGHLGKNGNKNDKGRSMYYFKEIQNRAIRHAHGKIKNIKSIYNNNSNTYTPTNYGSSKHTQLSLRNISHYTGKSYSVQDEEKNAMKANKTYKSQANKNSGYADLSNERKDELQAYMNAEGKAYSLQYMANSHLPKQSRSTSQRGLDQMHHPFDTITYKPYKRHIGEAADYAPHTSKKTWTYLESKNKKLSPEQENAIQKAEKKRNEERARDLFRNTKQK